LVDQSGDIEIESRYLMNSRTRFHETMAYGQPDRPPYFEEGLRPEVADAWHEQGLPRGTNPHDLFPVDRRQEIQFDLDPMPHPKKFPTSLSDLKDYAKRLNADDPKRIDEEWPQMVEDSRSGDVLTMLRVHRGFFLSMGVYDWQRFTEVMYLTMDDPEFVRRCMALFGEFAARMAERALSEAKVDAAVFSEPIGGNDRPLLSPQMYEDLVLDSYQPILDVLDRYGVKTLIFRTYANARLLIPCILKRGFNCLWACEVNAEFMDYQDIRREFGRDLRLIGGIDLDALRDGPEAIRREVETKVPPLLADGGYVPLADGRIREDVPYDHYVYYRRLLDRVLRNIG
jgi:hypothetical protein